MATTRGTIISPDRARQIRDFSGLCFGTITPTDIDGLIEYHDMAYILIELKLVGTELPHGQKLALERLTDDLRRTKPAICIIAEHNTINPDEPIDAASAIVIQYRQHKARWREPHELYTVREMIKGFLALLEPTK